ncbi:ribonuclease III [Rothia sp. ZJ1223]|uniref:ribonuclease III n=1 Tax=Rothia sp. ZJ1223 TaxID=2811098 RepID=UPI00195A8111|nr:ribonuclease III [Rothia sp. ZJ1223]MBM7050926.1 ribonuclease III [Rothia sp. ZJ1223]
MTDSVHRAFLQRLGVDIDAETFVLALTHRSYSFENNGVPHNERLEFLGDSVLSLAVAEELYRRLPDVPERELVSRHHAVVSTRTLAQIARSLGLGEHILLGKGEKQSGGANKDSILADTLEAIFGAVYMHQGREAARDLVLRLTGNLLEDEQVLGAGADWKTSVQELVAHQGLGEPSYRVDGVGPDHERRYTAVLVVAGEDIVASGGESSNKKEAEREAAHRGFEILKQRFGINQS